MEILNQMFFSEFRLRKYLKKQFILKTDSLHGPTHWKNVEEFGLRLADQNGADKKVVTLFAWIHDSCRKDEFDDMEHGARAANLAEELQGKYFKLTKTQFSKLHYAIKHHNEGQVSADVTIGTCWDADRLDLGRVGINPEERYMSTSGGRSMAKNA